MPEASRFVVAANGRIDTREELIAALVVAAELEHFLLVQYLFAAYALKKRVEEGVSEPQIELIRGWERTVLEVAHEEMIHFATVCKLSVAVGGSAHLDRPGFPLRAGDEFPFEMKLEPFGLESLERFIRFETPADQAVEGFGIAPDMPEYEYLGELYRQISNAFGELGDALIVGRSDLLGEEHWSLRRPVAAVTSAEQACAAIQVVVDEGEGATVDSPNSHYNRFRHARNDLALAASSDPSFKPARSVVANPTTRTDRAGSSTLLPEGPVRDLGELFNHVYSSVLMLIAQFYIPADESAAQRALVQACARRAMSAIVRPLAEVLTETPIADGRPERAGPPFETYLDIELGANAGARFAVLDERIRRAAEECTSLANELDNTRLMFLAENLKLLRENVASAAGGGGHPANTRL